MPACYRAPRRGFSSSKLSGGLRAIVALATCVATGNAAAAQAPPALRGFAESTQVTAVEIPVQVSRDGQAVRGLTAADFEVWNGKTLAPITGFDVIDLATPGAQRLSAPIPAAARRHFLLLFDLAYSEPKSIVKARDAARGVLIKQLVPSDLVAVATYAHSTGPRLVLGFTSDQRQIAAAIDHLGLPELVDRSADPLRLMADGFKQDLQTPSNTIGSQNGGPVGKANFQQMQAQFLEEIARASEKANRADQLANVAALAQSFTDLAKLMASVGGRKQVIYLSEGFASNLLQGTGSKKEQDNMADSVIYGQSYDVDSDARFGNTHQNNLMEKMMEAFRRSDCVIQSIDIGGLRGMGDQGAVRSSGEATLFQMSHDTGGELFRSFNDLGEAMHRLLAETSVTYLLTIQPAGLAADGSFHKLKVQLKNASRDVQVSFRSGFYAPVAYAKESPLARNLSAANTLMSGPRSGTVDMAVLSAPFRAAGAKAYVPVVIETDGPTLVAGMAPTAAGAAGAAAPASRSEAAAAADQLPAEIYIYAVDAQGQIQDYLDQALRFDLAKTPPALRQGGLKFFGHLELPPGTYWLRVLVRNGATGAFGMRATQLVVPEFDAARPVLLPPFFPEAPGHWLIVREQPRGALRNAAYPFMVAQQPFIPASRPGFAPGQEVPVALIGYNLGDAAMKPAAHVVAADGRDLGPAALIVAGRDAGQDGKPDQFKASFRLPASLPPGEYQLVLALDPAAAAGTFAPTSAGSFAVPALH
jgi:VWFA-related protein